VNDGNVEFIEVERDAAPHRFRIESPDLMPREAPEGIDVIQDGVGMSAPVVAEQQNSGLAAHALVDISL
jgi:hypothetical protein